ncbi:MAG: hypothetical protein ACI3XL_00645 [Eubacteriales bacterium]
MLLHIRRNYGCTLRGIERLVLKERKKRAVLLGIFVFKELQTRRTDTEPSAKSCKIGKSRPLLFAVARGGTAVALADVFLGKP